MEDAKITRTYTNDHESYIASLRLPIPYFTTKGNPNQLCPARVLLAQGLSYPDTFIGSPEAHSLLIADKNMQRANRTMRNPNTPFIKESPFHNCWAIFNLIYILTTIIKYKKMGGL